MNTHSPRFIVPNLFAAAALALSASAGAQTAAPPALPPATTSPQASPMTGHHKMHSAKPKQDADMKAECQSMMTKHQAMQEKLQAMDATLDKLVAEMNAAKESKAPDALEKPMAAVLNELVAQRKALRTMMMEMQPAMMSHMAHHMNIHGTKGTMKCPMMSSGAAPAPPAGETKPQM